MELWLWFVLCRWFLMFSIVAIDEFVCKKEKKYSIFGKVLSTGKCWFLWFNRWSFCDWYWIPGIEKWVFQKFCLYQISSLRFSYEMHLILHHLKLTFSKVCCITHDLHCKMTIVLRQCLKMYFRDYCIMNATKSVINVYHLCIQFYGPFLPTITMVWYSLNQE